ncbi:MAG: hypothetical protein JXR60_08445 [Bacteroidales bacterium]|nr:hypothetical protein [Bacteroidales bacterium]
MSKLRTLTVLLILSFVILYSWSCKKEALPKAIVKVVELIDSIEVPVNHAFVEVGPATKEEVLKEVLAEGYTNSSGVIEFEFDRELVLRAEASKYAKDEEGNIIYDSNNDPVVQKSGYKTLVLEMDYTDNKTIEVK